MPQSVIFPKLKPQWVFDRECVQFFAAVDGEQVLKCLVSAETLYTHFGAKDFSTEEATRAFLEHRGEIEAVAQGKILKGDYTSGDAVFLRTADFPQRATAPVPDSARSLRAVIDPALSDDPQLLSGVNEATAVLEQEFAPRSRRTTARWEAVPLPADKRLAQLTLADEETKATTTALFSARDLANLSDTRFSLFRLWDDLLRERGRRLLGSFQTSPELGASE